MTAEIFPLGGDWNNMLPLAGSWEGARVEISLNKDWVYTHDDLFSSKFSEFYGTFRILTASGDILYTKPAPLTYYGIVSGVGSITISFNYEEFTQLPLPQDSELTCCLYDYLDRYICSCTIRTSPFQRWSFSNYSKTIPDELVKAVFGSAKGRQLLQAAKTRIFPWEIPVFVSVWQRSPLWSTPSIFPPPSSETVRPWIRSKDTPLFPAPPALLMLTI